MEQPLATARAPMIRADGRAAGWAVSSEPVAYPDAVAMMERRVAAIAAGEAEDLVWLLEHPPIYTAGVSAKPQDLIAPDRFPVFSSGRGGQFTYHGPGQRVVYLMVDLGARTRDVRAFVAAMEAWIIEALAKLGVEACARPGRVGIWIESRDGAPEAKIAAIGVKVRRWVTLHGASLNVSPDLTHFEGIVACGLRNHGVTSLAALGAPADMASADAALRAAFVPVFGPVRSVAPPVLI